MTKLRGHGFSHSLKIQYMEPYFDFEAFNSKLLVLLRCLYVQPKIMSSKSDIAILAFICCMNQLGLGGSEEEKCSRNMVHLS